MAKKSILKTVAGLAVAGAAVGGAIAYVKKCKDVNALGEEDFDDLDDLMDEELSSCSTDRNYVPLPKENTEAAAEDETSESEEAE
ncbi:MAG: hypothetical protein EOM40_09965 [Clostridia bacterium]|nr:hypothetical protein [Clostridia bacterium]NCC45101.1 hypothetical protein [Clostridia bacterium]